MCSIGFWELVLVAIVAIIVINPNDIPKISQLIGLYIRKLQRNIASTSSHVQRFLDTSE